MVQVIKGLVVTLMVVAVGVVFFAIAYAGVHWYETGSFALIQDLDRDPFATLRRAYADVAVLGRYQQALYAAGLALDWRDGAGCHDRADDAQGIERRQVS